MKTRLWRYLFILFACVWLNQPLSAVAASNKFASATVKLHDLELLDQDGKTRRFKSDVIGDRLVAITFTYTTCTTICPILDSIFVTLQKKLGARLGKDIHLITMSIDPVNDIPKRLKAYARKLGAQPGWTFMTGSKVNMDKVLVGLDMYSPDIYNHPPSIIVGDGKTGTWQRFYGFPSADKILASLNELQKARRP
jgi:protein SCO1/2